MPVVADADLARLISARELVRAHDTDSVIAAAIPSLSEENRAAMARHVTLVHVALLIFPDILDGLAEVLARHGVDVVTTTPSVVVRDRLSTRYAVPVVDLKVDILRARVTDRTGRLCQVEIFALATTPELAYIAEDERAHNRENHVALAVPRADPVLLGGLRASVAGLMRPDGGGYNHHENSTVLYFRDPDHPDPAFRRLELISAGLFPHLLTTHQRQSGPGTELLRLMTGAWATQAITAAAQLRLPDHLGTVADLAGLAAATGADPDSLARLLRYLTVLGIVRTAGDRHTLTELGSLLRSDVDGSMRPLALMYGGPFYQSFAGLTEAVRTGEESYAKVFGAHHFVHMAADPGLAEVFHQSMAASNAMFTSVTQVVDFSTARTVVDVAGGNGELLYRILAANPGLRGVLMDRPHALAVAESTLAPVTDRCTLVSGDFTESVPGTGDVYLLSRVLHDWDDAQCRTILSTCAANMPQHAELLVIERLLPESPDPDSLAVPWDVHMMCNTGGKERTQAHYRALLAEAGFELVDVRPLALDAYVLRARRAGPETTARSTGTRAQDDLLCHNAKSW
ncbi:methyltransferase [Actinocrispum wychmicini]|nr:methyltransferase [Actinocrispum wychmicini]